MQSIGLFELRLSEHRLTEQAQNHLLFEGQETGFITEASDVVAQYRMGDLYLIATVLENPRKEKLAFYLLDAQCQVLSQKHYTGWFTTAFMVTGQRALSDQSIEITLNKTIRIQVCVEKTTWLWRLFRPWRLELKPIL